MTFTVFFCIAYVILFAVDHPLFIYYPVAKELHFGAQPAATGPGMRWYGFAVGAGLAAGLAALVIPGRWISPRVANWMWVFPVTAILCYFFFMRRFFL